jgi:hypothetical protein
MEVKFCAAPHRASFGFSILLPRFRAAEKFYSKNSNLFAALYAAHKTKIYSICLRMTGKTAEAEDLSQTALLQVFRKLASFRGDSALSTWIPSTSGLGPHRSPTGT